MSQQHDAQAQAAGDAHLIEQRISSKTVYQGDFLHIKRDEIRLPNGHTATREYIVHPGAVVIIALAEPGDVLRLTPDAEPTTIQTRSVLMERQPKGEGAWASC